MKCPVCGYENESDDLECIACASDMALAAESIAVEKRRSDEAMARYHEQQNELRRELGIKGAPKETPPTVSPGEPPLEMAAQSSPPPSPKLCCPQCGFGNRDEDIECGRCGVVFSKLKAPASGFAMGGPNSGESPGKMDAGALYGDLGETPLDPPVELGRRGPQADTWGQTKRGFGKVLGVAWRGLAPRFFAWMRWLKGLKPIWYGGALGVLLLMAALPFAWREGGAMKARWDLRAQVKQSQLLVEEFSRDGDAIGQEIRGLVDGKKFGEAHGVLQRFDIPALGKELSPLKRYLEEKELYAQVRKVPARKFEENYTLFTRLVILNPSSKLYRSKQALYKKRFADQCYREALLYSKSGKSDARESDEMVDKIEKARDFYPQNKQYKALCRELVRGNLLFYKGNANFQMALRDEGRGTSSRHRNQRKITVWMKNSSDKTLYINPEFFTLETSNGKRVKYNNMAASGFKGKLAPGEKTAGVLYFRTLAMPRQLIFEHLIAGTVQREFP